VSRFGDVVERLAAVLEGRRGADPTLAAKKLAEESLETALASLEQDGASLANESADLIYHWLAVLAGARISLDEVAAALEAREGRSGLEEKASRRG
jgi:phosphoribosyl-ATP pyrophosphohydrolase